MHSVEFYVASDDWSIQVRVLHGVRVRVSLEQLQEKDVDVLDDRNCLGMDRW